jgi:hypothetical protein
MRDSLIVIRLSFAITFYRIGGHRVLQSSILPFDRVQGLKYELNRKYYSLPTRRLSNEEWGVGKE